MKTLHLLLLALAASAVLIGCSGGSSENLPKADAAPATGSAKAGTAKGMDPNSLSAPGGGDGNFGTKAGGN